MSITVDDPKAAIKSSYDAAAAGWNRWFEWYEHNFQPSIGWCCDATALGPGSQVLDIACGNGQPAVAAARRVQPGGRVVAIDIAPEMVAAAASQAKRLGLDNVEFREGDAENLAFPDSGFDAVTCACGLMFCPDVTRTLAEVRRVLKPGGRAAFVVWDDPSKNPFITVAGMSLAQFFPPQPLKPDAPVPFRFAPPGVLERALQAAGFSEVTVESRPMTIECASAADYWQMFIDHAAGVKAKIAQLDDAGCARLRALVETNAQPYCDATGRVSLLATPLCGAVRR